jgi:hypothetical protein
MLLIKLQTSLMLIFTFELFLEISSPIIETQHDDTRHDGTWWLVPLSRTLGSYECLSDKCRDAECHYTKCHYEQFHYAECHNT